MVGAETSVCGLHDQRRTVPSVAHSTRPFATAKRREPSREMNSLPVAPGTRTRESSDEGVTSLDAEKTKKV